MFNERKIAYIWLSAAVTDNVKRLKLLSEAGDIVELFDNFTSLTQSVIDIVGDSCYARLNVLRREAEETARKVYESGMDVITFEDESYPREFENIYSPPTVLYIRGDASLLGCGRKLAVIGTRNPTRYGKDVTVAFTRELVHNGFTIVSGIARGIDSIAMRTALEEGYPAIGIVGNGLDVVYPPENASLYEEVTSKGAIVSEYAPGMPPLPNNFRVRNRLISGLASGVLVTEAGKNSGTMITVNDALEQGKDIFVVPGNVTSPASYGTNDMIKQAQGSIVTSASDITGYYGVAAQREEEPCDMHLDVLETKIVDFLAREERHFEEILAVVDINVNELVTLLAKLEMLGIIRKFPGNYYGI